MDRNEKQEEGLEEKREGQDSKIDEVHGRFNALLRVTKSLAHVTLHAGYFSPGTCIATSWTVFSTLLLLWPQAQFKRTSKTLPTLRKNCMQVKPSKIAKRKAVSIAYHFPI